MDLVNWINELRVLLEELKEKNLAYLPDDNYVRPPGETAVLQELLAKTGLSESSQIATFYRTCDGLSLPDVWNGYFIHPTSFTLNSLERGPLSVSGPLACRILVFGSNGGGGLFALSVDRSGQVLHLPEDGVTGAAVFDGNFNPVTLLSLDLFGFLIRLLSDVQAFTEGRKKWKYMV